jgi:membrane associated rhomboid family serine protease
MTSGRDLFGPKLGLTLPLCGLHFVFFFLVTADPEKTYRIFAFLSGQPLRAPWSFVTYQFLHSSAFDLFFGALALYVLGMALEAEWGTPEYTAFWLVATLGGSLSAWLVKTPLLGDPFVVPISMLFAFAYLFPETRFLVFFVIPVKVRWIAYLAAAFLAYTFFSDLLRAGFGVALVRVAGASSGFLFFWIRQHGRFHARKATQKAIVAARVVASERRDDTLSRRNRELFPKVEVLRSAAKNGAELPPEMLQLSSDLGKLVVPGVNICKPVDFKGDKDDVCLRCEGFAECSLRYVAGQPVEIVVKTREP